MEKEQNYRKPKYDKEKYLNFEMPSDDMDTDIRNWSSKLLRVRTDTVCAYCGADIKKRDYALAEKGFHDGQPFYVHDCLDCVEETMDMQDGKLDTDDALDRWTKRARESGYLE